MQASSIHDRLKLSPEDISRLEHKARARVTWGDSREEVERMLRTKGLDPRSIQRMLDGLFRERAASIRSAAAGLREAGAEQEAADLLALLDAAAPQL